MKNLTPSNIDAIGERPADPDPGSPARKDAPLPPPIDRAAASREWRWRSSPKPTAAVLSVHPSANNSLGEKHMKLFSRKQAFASVIAMGLVAGSASVIADETSRDVVDARHETRISTAYAFHPELNSQEIAVSVDSGKATLTGQVDEDIISELAKQVALQVDGVTEVDNRIVVGDDGSSSVEPAAGRSFGTVIDDVTITTEIKSKLMWSKHTEGLATDVSTESGKVILEGVADSEAASDHAERLASNTRGAVSVDNRLIVDVTHSTFTEKAKVVANDAGQDIADGWITTKVKSTLLYSSNVSGADITVRTDNDGIVTLSGKVSGESEKELAIALAQNVLGVKSVLSDELVF